MSEENIRNDEDKDFEDNDFTENDLVEEIGEENEKPDGMGKKVKEGIGRIKKNYIWMLLGILVIAVVLARSVGTIKQILMKPEEEVKEAGQVFQESTPVKVYKIKRMDFQDTLPAMGKIEGFKEIELRFDNKGIMESFNFEEGERILEGDIIASLDQQDALLKLKYAALELEKNKKLFDLGGVDKMAVDQKKLEYESSKRELEKTNIYAPSDGYLGSKERGAGTFVMSQDKVGIFVDFSEVYAVFDVIEEDSPKIELGQNVEIFLDAYPGTNYNGTVDTVAPMIEGRTRTQKIKIELENKEDELKPGMFARAIINTYESKDALVIPSSSFRKEENKYYVYVVHPEKEEIEQLEGYDSDIEGLLQEAAITEEDETEEEMGLVEKREISIEYLTHDIAEIRKGVEEGELIIRELHREYKNNDRVEITEVQETIF
ncbi:MAG: efflux RND transporter periplasmic adaptor subunit [Candidatus Aadella gelida]|nr:efflux RND transporter periplasmic adaptor subunit [Candidatus Aadella gelida]